MYLCIKVYLFVFREVSGGSRTGGPGPSLHVSGEQVPLQEELRQVRVLQKPAGESHQCVSAVIAFSPPMSFLQSDHRFKLNPPKLRSNYPRKQSIRPLDSWPPSYKSPKYVNITKFPHFCFSCGTWETPLCNPFPAIQEQLVHVPPHWASVLLFPREPVLNTYKPKAFDKYAWTGVE